MLGTTMSHEEDIDKEPTITAMSTWLCHAKSTICKTDKAQLVKPQTFDSI